MKTKLIILALFAFTLGSFYQPQSLLASDRQSGQKVNDKGNEMRLALNHSSKSIQYKDVKLSDSKLVDEQNEFIFSSMEEEKIYPDIDWTGDLGHTIVEKIYPLSDDKEIEQKKESSGDKAKTEGKKGSTKVKPKDTKKTTTEDKAIKNKKEPKMRIPAKVGKPQPAKEVVKTSPKQDQAPSRGKKIWTKVSSVFKKKPDASQNAKAKSDKDDDKGKTSASVDSEISRLKEMKKILADADQEKVAKVDEKTTKKTVKAATYQKQASKVVKSVSDKQAPARQADTKNNKAIVLAATNKTNVHEEKILHYQKSKEDDSVEEITVDEMVETFTDDDWITEADGSQADNNEGFVQKAKAIQSHMAEEHEDDVDETNDESFWKKVERKLSPSGMTKEEVAELDYWDVPVEEQKIEYISERLTIDAAFKEAREIKLPDVKPAHHMKEPEVTKVFTPKELILQAIPKAYHSKTIDLDFDDTNLSDILLIMGDAGNINIVLDPVLKNNTLDLHLKKIRIDEALLLVANSYDLGFKLVGNALFITEKEKLRFENKVSKVIKVRNVSVEEAKLLVEDLADQVNFSAELNSLTVVGDPQDVDKVEEIIKSIDTPQPQLILEAKIIEVNKDALKDLGVDWSKQINLRYQESGRPQDFDNVEDSLSSLYKIAQIQRNPLQFETTIKMLENQNKAKVLSAPRVTTLNGKQAEIFVGDEVPYTITNITGGVVTNDVRFVEPGIRLTITPSIIDEEFVVMMVEPEVSFIVAFRGPNDEFPQVRTREATAHVRVNNKQPFVLGGILNQEDKQILFKVPFFGKLPLFGNLFSYQKSNVVDTELIITVIPTIVHGYK